MECAELEMNQGRRHLEENQGFGLFVGPYCAEQGGSIHLGVFLDDSCSEFADSSQGRETFQSITGMQLPYADENIVKADSCMSCMYNPNWEGQDGNGQYNQVAELCEQLYYPAGKCEQRLPSRVVNEPNNFACGYIEGIQTVHQDGISRTRKANAGTTFFITFLFLFTFGLLLYVHYLRTRLGLKIRLGRESRKETLLNPHEEEPANIQSRTHTID